PFSGLEAEPKTLLPDGEAESPVETPAQSPERVGGYEILQVLGRGGMGVVYKARHIALNRLVALKMIRAGAHAGPEKIARFRREAEAVARLQHPNIMQIYDIGQEGELPYLSLEFVDGGSLTQKLAQGPLAPLEAAQLVERIARAVGYAHRKGILHRDLKPANVLLTSDGIPKVTDFGLAKLVEVDVEVEVATTAHGVILGTPLYMAPEQASGRIKELSPAADVYSLGVILYQMLTGRPPFKAGTVLETLMMVKTK